MRGIGVHVCEGCGNIFPTLGRYLDCMASHATCYCGQMEDLNLPCWCENTIPGFQLDPEECRWEDEGGQPLDKLADAS